MRREGWCAAMEMKEERFWSLSEEEILKDLEASEKGLSQGEAERRLARFGRNLLTTRKKSGVPGLIFAQFKSPIVFILLCASTISLFLGQYTDSAIIFAIIIASALLGFLQEYSAAGAVEKLLAIVHVKSRVIRNGTPVSVPLEEVVPGDIVSLSAGDNIPGDCRILSSQDLFVDEAVLTGETYPVEKTAGTIPPDSAPGARSNCLFMGTHVTSGSASAIVALTGRRTAFGQIYDHLQLRSPETEFERGIRRFGYLLMEVTSILVFGIFAINVFLHKPVLDSFLFAVALAVGLTPQLLPAIISINLSHGAREMALHKVIVKRLSSIENFGSMNILCSDKTGTITEGKVRLHSFIDVERRESEKVLLYAFLNSCLQMGFKNPIDDAILSYRTCDVGEYTKLGEVPYDFLRKRLSVAIKKDQQHLLITKGALTAILDICSQVEAPDGSVKGINEFRKMILGCYEELSGQGYRTIGVAYRPIDSINEGFKSMEKDMIFLGFIVLFDPPKEEIEKTIKRLRDLSVSLKVITGDNSLVAAHMGKALGIENPRVLSGGDIRKTSDGALLKLVRDVNIFAEVEPNQKEQIILALKKSGNVVGYMGDGINDAPALHAADVSISVNSAVDVAKESADIVLLENNLDVLADGVVEGRKTFSNTLKYVFMATSANFGNMFSMAGASLFLSFLPLLPKQILLTNLLTDFPEMAIARDNVDVELLAKPRRWNIGFIRSFMIVFGLVSSLFDYLTFGVLLFLLKASPDEFRCGWFTESVISAILVVFIIRSQRPFFKSSPGRHLLIISIAVIALVLLLPYTPPGRLFGFNPLPIQFYAALLIILIFYVATAEVVKSIFYRKTGSHQSRAL
jgi:P-type Mg2+ transporter